jgi:hypothetical protein
MMAKGVYHDNVCGVLQKAPVPLLAVSAEWAHNQNLALEQDVLFVNFSLRVLRNDHKPRR